jgi:hypothetical protein
MHAAYYGLGALLLIALFAVWAFIATSARRRARSLAGRGEAEAARPEILVARRAKRHQRREA